jgi:hypothetical protein
VGLLGAATVGGRGEKPSSVGRHREVAPRRSLGISEEYGWCAEFEQRRHPDGTVTTRS